MGGIPLVFIREGLYEEVALSRSQNNIGDLTVWIFGERLCQVEGTASAQAQEKQQKRSVAGMYHVIGSK